MRLTVTARIAGGYAVVLFLAAGILIVGMLGLNSVNDSLLVISDKSAPMISATSRMQSSLLQAKLAVMRHFQLSNLGELSRLEQVFDEQRKQYEQARSTLQLLTKEQPRLEQALTAADAASTQVFQQGPAVMKAHRVDTEKGIHLVKQKREFGDMGDELTGLLSEIKGAPAQAKTWGSLADQIAHSVSIGLEKNLESAVLAVRSEVETKFGEIDKQAEAISRADPAQLKARQSTDRIKAASVGESGLLTLYAAQLKLRKEAAGALGQIDESSVIALQQIGAMTKVVDELTASTKQSAAATMQSSTGLLTVFALVALLVSVVVAAWIIRAISSQLGNLSGSMVAMEHDLDFTRRVTIKGNDELTVAARSFNRLVATVQNALHETHEASAEIAGVARKLLNTAGQVANGSAKQSDAAGAMAASIEQLSTSISHVTDGANQARSFSRDAGERARSGREVIDRTVNEMSGISTEINLLGGSVDELGRRSQEISSIVQVIKDVAGQTNLLALNAAIEAARAGEQGRGFAVVADEVRKLAERTTGATLDIASKIGAIQSSIEIAVKAVRSTVEKVESGVTLTRQAGGAMHAITAGTQEVEQQVSAISGALVEQNIASQQIAVNVEQIADMTEQNSRASNEASYLANELETVVHRLEASISRFRN
ncbi:methyl-accepting chemotaxis protein [Chitinimonas arctica]|uniref:Methyl-accepting chemotaxis protein n=1 Tax=Chitinimonas arctica TaxID=2594795 RepID=A0A516SL93_9NEIS|nr:methyl-accepting chemotaxis protein [Chitinimonas arctica]QDQ28788.1 methyl-accepting chemotaxis protein [Chitinimonas arctica]